MIRFRCIYCGREISVGQALAGKRIACPACDHIVRVHPKETGAALKPDAARTAETTAADANRWEGKTNAEITRWLQSQQFAAANSRRSAARNAVSRSLVQFDDLTLFALSAALVFLLLIDSGPRREFGEAVWKWPAFMLHPRVTAVLFCAAIGMILSFVNVFFRWEKHRIEKWLMLLFAVLISAGTGAYAGYVTLKETWSWLIVFPAWNIINCLLLLSMFHAGIVNTGSITGERPRLLQVVLTLVSIALLLALGHYVLKLHWAVAYSICVCYAMNLHRAVQDFFGPRPRRT